MNTRFMTTTELADYLCYRGAHRLRSVYRFIATNGVKVTRRGKGGELLVVRADVERALAMQRGKVA